MAIKIIEVIGVGESMESAVENAVEEAAKTIRKIQGVDVVGWTAKTDGGKISSWSADVKIAFEVER